MAVLSVAKIISRRNPWVQLRILIATVRSLQQARRMEGFLEAKAIPDGRGVYFVLTRWADEASLKAYVHSGAHGKAARRSQRWAKSHVSVHVEWEGELPTHDEVGALLENARIIDTPHVGELTDREKRLGPSRVYRLPLTARPKR